MNKKLELKDYLDAGYSCIFFKTGDYLKAKEIIDISHQELKYNKLMWWDAARGFNDNVLAYGSDYSSGHVIHALIAINKEKKSILVVENARQFIDDYKVIQQVINSILSARLNGSHIIFVGSELLIPPELKSFISVYDCPLPTRVEIRKEYIKWAKGYKKAIDLPKSKKALNALLEDAVNASIGLDMMSIENAFALSAATTGGIDINVIQKQKEQEIKKSDVLEFINTNETLDNVGGFKKLKEWLKSRQKAFTIEARKYGLPYPKGILITGIPGTGKSLACKAIAAYLKLPLIRLDMCSIYSSFVGDSEARIREALKIIDTISPVVLWIDEIERGAAGANSSNLDAGVSSRVISTILTWRQETKSGCFMVATANDIDDIPTPLLRKGRFDEIWATDLPNEEEREEIFRIHCEKRHITIDVSFLYLALMTTDFVGSEIEGIIEDALFNAFTFRRKVSAADIENAISEIIPQAQRNVEEIKKIRKWIKERARNVS